MVWNGIQDIHGKRVDHDGSEWDFALEWKQVINSHAVGMAVAHPYGFEIDLVRKPISGSAA